LEFEKSSTLQTVLWLKVRGVEKI